MRERKSKNERETIRGRGREGKRDCRRKGGGGWSMDGGEGCQGKGREGKIKEGGGDVAPPQWSPFFNFFCLRALKYPFYLLKTGNFTFFKKEKPTIDYHIFWRLLFDKNLH